MSLMHLVGCVILVSICSGAFIGEVKWNISNPLFKYDVQTDGVVLQACPMDYAIFSCPYWGDPKTNPVIFQYLVVHSVSRAEFESCQIAPQNTDTIGLVCLSPDRITDSHTSVFEPSQFDSAGFRYFISTSTGVRRNWEQTYGGLCIKENMRLRVQLIPEHKCNREAIAIHNSQVLSLQGFEQKFDESMQGKVIAYQESLPAMKDQPDVNEPQEQQEIYIPPVSAAILQYQYAPLPIFLSFISVTYFSFSSNSIVSD